MRIETRARARFARTAGATGEEATPCSAEPTPAVPSSMRRFARSRWASSRWRARVQAQLTFVREQALRLLGLQPELFPVSARQALAAKGPGDPTQRAATWEVEIQKKYAIAAACLIFALLGAPIGLRFQRGGVGLVIAVSVAVLNTSGLDVNADPVQYLPLPCRIDTVTACTLVASVAEPHNPAGLHPAHVAER